MLDFSSQTIQYNAEPNNRVKPFFHSSSGFQTNLYGDFTPPGSQNLAVESNPALWIGTAWGFHNWLDTVCTTQWTEQIIQMWSYFSRVKGQENHIITLPGQTSVFVSALHSIHWILAFLASLGFNLTLLSCHYWWKV